MLIYATINIAEPISKQKIENIMQAFVDQGILGFDRLMISSVIDL
jgi:hypothetical protein